MAKFGLIILAWQNKNLENENQNNLPASDEDEEKTTRFGEIIIVLLCVSLVLSVVAFGTVDSWAQGILCLGATSVGLLWMCDTFFNKEFTFSKNLLQIPVLGLILLGLIQLLPLFRPNVSDIISVPAVSSVSLDPYSTRLFVIQLIALFIYFAATLMFLNSPKRLKKVVYTIMIFGMFAAIFAILQNFSSPDAIYGIRFSSQALGFGSFVNRHHFAAFMEMTIAVTLGLIYAKAIKKDQLFLHGFMVVLMGVALILTMSRGALLSFLGVLAFLTLANFLRKPTEEEKLLSKNDRTANFGRKIALFGGGLTLILLVFGTVLLLGGGDSLIRSIGFTNQADASSGRFGFWQTTLQIIANNPIIGVGLDAFGVAFTKYDTQNGLFRIERAHNDYLQILADAGILGFACVVSFIYLLFKRGVNIISTTSDRFGRGISTGALAGCFGILIHSFFDFPLRTPSNALYFLTLTAIATVAIKFPKELHRRKIRE